jgi:hypothetical protein
MIKAEEIIKIQLHGSIPSMTIEYQPTTERTLYDVCDLNGRIVKTGIIEKKVTEVDTSDLSGSHYILLILDGDRVTSRKFKLRA